MKPRLKSSKKWTAFPKEYSDQIKTVFTENFAPHLKNASLIVEGRIYPEEVTLRVGILEKGRLTQANFEVSMDYSIAKQDTIARIHNCIDAAASMMLDYLENEGDVDFPYSWKDVSFQGQKIYMQFNTENSSLEEQANKLLGLSEEDLLNEDNDESEDALLRADTTLPSSENLSEEDETEEDAAAKKKNKLH